MAHQAEQIYYLSYPSKHQDRQEWWVVCKTRTRHNFDNVFGADKPKFQVGDVDGEVYQDDEIHDCAINSTLV